MEKSCSLTRRVPTLQTKTGQQKQATTPTMLQKHVSPEPMMNPDSSRRERREEESVLNTVLNTNTTIRIVKSFSIPPDKIHVLTQFSQIARREAGSRGFSEVIIKALEEYNRKHEAGNPQLKLSPYIDANAPSPMRVLCLHLDGALSDGTVHCTRKGMWTKGLNCYSCKHNRLRKTK